MEKPTVRAEDLNKLQDVGHLKDHPAIPADTFRHAPPDVSQNSGIMQPAHWSSVQAGTSDASHRVDTILRFERKSWVWSYTTRRLWASASATEVHPGQCWQSSRPAGTLCFRPPLLQAPNACPTTKNCVTRVLILYGGTSADAPCKIYEGANLTFPTRPRICIVPIYDEKNHKLHSSTA